MTAMQSAVQAGFYWTVFALISLDRTRADTITIAFVPGAFAPKTFALSLCSMKTIYAAIAGIVKGSSVQGPSRKTPLCLRTRCQLFELSTEY